MTNDRSVFASHYPVPQSIIDLGADSRARIVEQGDDVLEVRVHRNATKLFLKMSNIYQLYAPYFLFSKVQQSLGYVHCLKYKVNLHSDDSAVDTTYAFDVDYATSETSTALVANLGLRHQRLAHLMPLE